MIIKKDVFFTFAILRLSEFSAAFTKPRERQRRIVLQYLPDIGRKVVTQIVEQYNLIISTCAKGELESTKNMSLSMYPRLQMS
jgi:hypothetical protein